MELPQGSLPESWKIRHLTSQSLVQNGRCPPGSVILQITTKRAREWGNEEGR